MEIQPDSAGGSGDLKSSTVDTTGSGIAIANETMYSSVMETDTSQEGAGDPTTANKSATNQDYFTSSQQSQPSDVGTQPTMKECVTKMLDELDERVEKLRRNAINVENERDDVLSSLDALYNAELVYELEGIDLDEVNRYIERLARRCMTVQVQVQVERSQPQMDSLHMVNNMIDSLIRDLKKDAMNARKRCIAYINSCSEQVSNIPTIDAAFENAVLGCSGDDQKRIKKRLTGLYSYFNSASGFSVEEEVDVEVSEAIERSIVQN